jgi:[acyl-carrier-protein] S-malonyltransferase
MLATRPIHCRSTQALFFELENPVMRTRLNLMNILATFSLGALIGCAPFHCALMQPAADRLAGELAQIEFRVPSVPVITNVEATPNQDPQRLRALLVEQVTAPVRWEESVQKLAALGVTQAVEVGAGAVLAGLVKRIAPGIEVRPAGDPEAMRSL